MFNTDVSYHKTHNSKLISNKKQKCIHKKGISRKPLHAVIKLKTQFFSYFLAWIFDFFRKWYKILLVLYPFRILFKT